MLRWLACMAIFLYEAWYRKEAAATTDCCVGNPWAQIERRTAPAEISFDVPFLLKFFLFICLFFKSPWGLSAINGISIREAFLWQQVTKYVCNPSALGIVYYFDSDYFYLKHICICCATINISEIHKSKTTGWKISKLQTYATAQSCIFSMWKQ